MDIASTRNFSIIAHIDHGKSTLADRLLERTGAISSRHQVEQVLDRMDLERERGITIKAKAVTIFHERNGRRYQLNLIDTPGHVDFSYEVSRSLAACEGALLLVDAAQGIEAQTVANLYLALESGLEVIPVINKIDLAAARVDEVKKEIVHIMGIDPDLILCVSAKDGAGVDDVFNAVVERIPSPKGDPSAPARALIFDSVYDEYRGVIVYVRVMDGRISKRDHIKMLRTGGRYEVLDLGMFRPQMVPVDSLNTGEVGYLICNIKTLRDVHVGDTVTLSKYADVTPLPGYKEPLPMVYCGLYPVNHAEVTNLRAALEKLQLNDSSFTFAPESSEALGFGFRCGFLGLLHMEIVQERLERESNVDVVQTAPNVTYEVVTTDRRVLRIEGPSELPEPHEIAEFREPVARVNLVMPAEHIGNVMGLTEERHADYISTEYLGTQRVVLAYEMPLSELIFDFYDNLKSATRGYGTMDYEIAGFRPADLVRVDILVGDSLVDALSIITRRDNAERRGRAIIKRLQKEIPRHLFEVALQAAIGGKIIARENIKPLRKNVTAKCYGGDVSRKRKLLEKQKAGKKRMKRVGNVEIPQNAFLAVLKTGRDEQGRK
ncbi:MAG: translation elongation factor 4 [Planctomycetota bacterium]